ncbi:MAG TPA: hypothetical protein VF756_06855 [Thermoanaerobaculia bacterium]
MKTGLLLGSFLLVLLFIPSSAQAQWCQGVDGPYWCGDPNACEGICGEPGATCDTPCEGFGGNWTTCGGGGPDYDGDGVANESDNCLCQANSSQADCDTDGWGDVCDPRNEKWVFVEDLGRCETDSDVHWNKFTIEQFAAKRYRNECDGSYCSDRYLISSASCNFSSSGCGTSAGACCNCHYPFSWCTGIATCGSPDCPF